METINYEMAMQSQPRVKSSADMNTNYDKHHYDSDMKTGNNAQISIRKCHGQRDKNSN